MQADLSIISDALGNSGRRTLNNFLQYWKSSHSLDGRDGGETSDSVGILTAGAPGPKQAVPEEPPHISQSNFSFGVTVWACGIDKTRIRFKGEMWRSELLGWFFFNGF